MLKSTRIMQVGLAAATLTLAVGPLRAAVLNEDFESYEVGQTLVSQNNSYAAGDDTIIAQNLSDPVNNTKVLQQGSDFTSLQLPSMTGRIQFSIDVKFPDNTRNRNIYLLPTSSNRPLYIQIRDDGRLAVRVGYETQGNKYLANPYLADQWYRLTAVVDLDPNDGGNSKVEDVSLFTLKEGGEIGTVVGHFTDLETYGKPTTANGTQISGGGVLFDNWQISQVPEPAMMSLLGLGGLLLIRRR